MKAHERSRRRGLLIAGGNAGTGVKISGVAIGLDIDASTGIAVDIDGITGGITSTASAGNGLALVGTGGLGLWVDTITVSGATTLTGAVSCTNRGFTLIEVLAALVIVALGMLGVIQAVTQTARNGTYLREKTLAHWIAMNVITEQRLQPSAPEVSETSDEVEFAGQRWAWKMTGTQTSVESMRRMDVSVRPVDWPEDRSLTTLTSFYGEAIAPANAAPLSWTSTQAPAGDDDGEGDGEGDDGGAHADDGRSPRPERPPRPQRPPEDPDE